MYIHETYKNTYVRRYKVCRLCSTYLCYYLYLYPLLSRDATFNFLPHELSFCSFHTCNSQLLHLKQHMYIHMYRCFTYTYTIGTSTYVKKVRTMKRERERETERGVQLVCARWIHVMMSGSGRRSSERCDLHKPLSSLSLSSKVDLYTIFYFLHHHQYHHHHHHHRRHRIIINESIFRNKREFLLPRCPTFLRTTRAIWLGSIRGCNATYRSTYIYICVRVLTWIHFPTVPVCGVLSRKILRI